MGRFWFLQSNIVADVLCGDPFIFLLQHHTFFDFGTPAYCPITTYFLRLYLTSHTRKMSRKNILPYTILRGTEEGNTPQKQKAKSSALKPPQKCVEEYSASGAWGGCWGIEQVRKIPDRVFFGTLSADRRQRVKISRPKVREMIFSGAKACFCDSDGTLGQ